ncbi:uncharacterized protein LOC111518829 [Drosophila willistoni]|uniref:uncharacterized protein LOC111518829 n=1 Tax=Drosophila willistoni TaxID=7260 RepID=UPI00017D7AD8|nr:uncharacterized protein LOC111518829 [Drosophila willistoni]
MEQQNLLIFGIDEDKESSVELLQIVESALEGESGNRTNATLKSTLEHSASDEDSEDDSSISFCNSPPTKPIKMIVKAVVHHPLDWSPSPNNRDELLTDKESKPKHYRDKLEQDDSGFVEEENSLS